MKKVCLIHITSDLDTRHYTAPSTPSLHMHGEEDIMILCCNTQHDPLPVAERMGHGFVMLSFHC